MSTKLTLSEEELREHMQSAHSIYVWLNHTWHMTIHTVGNTQTQPEYDERMKELQEHLMEYYEVCQKELEDVVSAADSLFDFDAQQAQVVEQSELSSNRSSYKQSAGYRGRMRQGGGDYRGGRRG